MGLFDRFKKTKNEENLATTHDTVNESTQSEFDSYSYINGKMEELDNTPSVRRINSIVRDEATQVMENFEREKKEKEFTQKYKKIIGFKREFDHIKCLKDLGLQYTKPKSEQMKRYEILCSKNAMPKRDIDRIFLPYLVERKSIGIITESEQAELDKIFGKTMNFSELLNATTQQSYTQDYNRSLIMLGIIGVLDIDKQGNILEFDNGKSLRDSSAIEDSLLCGDMYSIGKRIGLSVDGIPQNIKDFMDAVDLPDKKEDILHSKDTER